MSDDNNKGDGKKKRKNLSGRALFSNSKKEAEELSNRLSNNKNMDEKLIQTPECLSYDMLCTPQAVRDWAHVKDGTLNERLAFGASFGDLKLVDQCLRFGADVNHVCEKTKVPVIFLAASCKAYYVIQRFLEEEDLNLLVKDTDGMSPSEVTATGTPNGDLTEILLNAEMQQATKDGVDFKDFLNLKHPVPGAPEL